VGYDRKKMPTVEVAATMRPPLRFGTFSASSEIVQQHAVVASQHWHASICEQQRSCGQLQLANEN